MGSTLPLTVTQSISLNSYFKSGEQYSYNFSDINKGTPNYLVAASNQLLILTLGDKYEASILWELPIAPSIAHPKLRPNPIVT